MANIGPPVQAVRDELVAAGITINGLAILASEPWLESYYNEYVIGGAGAFLLRAEDFGSFASAMQSKLQGEVAGLTPSGARRIAGSQPAMTARPAMMAGRASHVRYSRIRCSRSSAARSR